MNSPARLARGVWPSRRHDVKSARVCRVFKNGAGNYVRVPATNVLFVLFKLSAKLVFLGNGILVIPFFDIGKWLFVLTLKSHLNNVLRVMFTLRDRRIMRENCYCPRPKNCVYFSYIPQGNLKLGYGLAYSLTKVPKLKQVV